MNIVSSAYSPIVFFWTIINDLLMNFQAMQDVSLLSVSYEYYLVSAGRRWRDGMGAYDGADDYFVFFLIQGFYNLMPLYFSCTVSFQLFLFESHVDPPFISFCFLFFKLPIIIYIIMTQLSLPFICRLTITQNMKLLLHPLVGQLSHEFI